MLKLGTFGDEGAEGVFGMLGAEPPPPNEESPLAVAATCAAILIPALTLLAPIKAAAVAVDAPNVGIANAAPCANVIAFAACVAITVFATLAALSPIRAAA